MIKASINNVEGILFYGERKTIEQAPIGYPFVYFIRHDESNWIRPISIEKFVLVNFFGTMFTKAPFNLSNNDYIEVTSFWMDQKDKEFTIYKIDFEKDSLTISS